MTLQRYSLAVAAVAAAMPLYLWRVTIAGLPTNIFELLVAALIVVGISLPPVRRQWREAEEHLPRAVIWLVGLFVLAALLSAVISDVPRVSFGIFKSWIIVPLLLGWIVYSAHLKIENWKLKIEDALIFSGTIVALVSLTQFHWGERLAGIYDVPNSLALYLAPLVVLAVTRAITNYELRITNYFQLFSAVPMFLVLVLTQSVAGISAVLFVLVGFSLFQFRTWPHFEIWPGFIIGLGVCSILAALYLGSTGRLAYSVSPITNSIPNSVSVRRQLWSVSWELIQEHPLLGIGLGQFEPAYQEKLHERVKNFESRPPAGLAGITNHESPPLREFVFRDPHNWILSFWLNIGLLGLLSFAGLHVWLFWRLRDSLFPPIRRAGMIRDSPMVITAADDSRFTIHDSQAAMLALLTLLLFGLVDTIYWKNDLAALQWVLTALLLRRLG